MIRDFLKNDPKIPYLAFHTMTECNNLYVIYGGLISNDNISGDLLFMKSTGRTFTVAAYEKNKTGKTLIKIKFSLYLGSSIRQIGIQIIISSYFLEDTQMNHLIY